jgi:ATP-dependent Clp protease protease subunit
MAAKVEKKNREFLLNEDVTESSMGNLIKEIRELNRYDDEEEEEKREYVREPIVLIIGTYGGSVYDCLGLLAQMQLSKTPIHTVCLSKAMSAGFMLMAAGHKRFAHSYATFMYHTLASGAWGKIQTITESVEELERLHKLLESLVLKHTNITSEKLDDIRKYKKDWYIPAEEARKLGIIDEILVA